MNRRRQLMIIHLL